MSDRCGGRRLLSLFLLVTILCAGCVSPRGLSKSSIQFNRAVEQGQNQVLLLNIIRASHRRPMYLTSFSKVTGSNSASFNAGFNNSVGDDTFGGSFGVNPTFDVPVLDSQEFTSGFLKPVDTKVLAYYWDQDWPEELLLHLLVQKVRVRVQGSVQGRDVINDYYYWNYPDASDPSLCKLEKFTRWVRHFTVVANPGFAEVEAKQIGPAFPSHAVGLDSAVTLTKEGLILEGDEDKLTFLLKPGASKYVLEVEGNLEWDATLDKKQRNERASGLSEEMRREETLKKIANWAEASTKWDCGGEDAEVETYSIDEGPAPEPRDSGPVGSEPGKAGNEEVSIDLFIRSPEAVLYYLGQLARVEEQLDKVPRICVGSKVEPLFVARPTGLGCFENIVTVTYDGKWYTIPKDPEERKRGSSDAGAAEKGEAQAQKNEPEQACAETEFRKPGPEEHLYIKLADLDCDPGRSMHALSLITQIINLQKSAKDLPTTGTVRVVGQ